MSHDLRRYLDILNEAVVYRDPDFVVLSNPSKRDVDQMRTKATQELGPNFDVREFHDVVLGQGAVPLDVLDKVVNDWIAEKKSSVVSHQSPKK